MPNAVEYFLGSRSDVVQLELLEISHSSFSQVYRLVRNAIHGVTVTIDVDGVPTEADFEYYPMAIKSIGNKPDLEAGFRIDWGDLGDVVPKEIDRVWQDGTFDEKPKIRYWTFRSDDLTEPMFGPLHLQMSSVSSVKANSSFDAKAPSLNVNRTGELYSFSRFPMLRGFL